MSATKPGTLVTTKFAARQISLYLVLKTEGYQTLWTGGGQIEMGKVVPHKEASKTLQALAATKAKHT